MLQLTDPLRCKDESNNDDLLDLCTHFICRSLIEVLGREYGHLLGSQEQVLQDTKKVTMLQPLLDVITS